MHPCAPDARLCALAYSCKRLKNSMRAAVMRVMCLIVTCSRSGAQRCGLKYAVASTVESEGTEELRSHRCPVSDRAYTATGPEQPVFLPECGHTYSRRTVAGLFRAQRAHGRSQTHIRCTLCITRQGKLASADECIPNWDTIQRLQQRPRRRQKMAAIANTSPHQRTQHVEAASSTAKV